jgi:hypothetical protein
MEDEADIELAIAGSQSLGVFVGIHTEISVESNHAKSPQTRCSLK